MKSHWEILVVDDEEVMRESLAAWLREDGYRVDTASSGREAIEKARGKDYAMYFIDLKMPGGIDGIETMMQVRNLHADASIVIITAYATVDTAIAAMKEGAQEYIVKPCNLEEISLLVNRIMKVRNLQRENALLRKRLRKAYTLEDIISKNPRMQEIFKLIREVASLRSTVLIQGESGTGKDLIARAIHSSGDRLNRPFVAVSCAALTETLLESELFGYEKGAFTGATSQKKGKFEAAHSGTLFLDEIGDIPAKLQMDLLRVLQEKSFYRVGGTEEVRVDVRVVAATNSNLQEAVRDGKFREDLFYRLNVINIRIPPLRERLEDIPMLVRHFVERLGPETGKEVDEVSEDGLEVLLKYSWPGNVRELENVIERAIVTSKSRTLTAADFSFLSVERADSAWAPPPVTLQELEKQAIEAAIRRTQGNIKEAAAQLGIDRSTLYEKIKKYEISRSRE